MASRVQLPGDGRAIDEPWRSEIRGVLGSIADALVAVPPANAFWDSMESSILRIEVGGFHIVYRIEPDHHGIRVIELQQIPGQVR